MRKKIILSMILIGILFLVGCQQQECPDCICPEQEECMECEECKVCEEPQIAKEKAMLDIDMYIWAINEYDNSELLFDYWIYNYGDIEAKDVNVKCKLEDTTGKILTSITKYYGNLASQSVELGEIVTKKPTISMTKEYVGYCYVESCSNCEILYKRIPKLVESYETN